MDERELDGQLYREGESKFPLICGEMRVVVKPANPTPSPPTKLLPSQNHTSQHKARSRVDLCTNSLSVLLSPWSKILNPFNPPLD